MDLDLYRVKVFASHSNSLFDPQTTLLRCIQSRPSSKSRGGSKWSVGNVEPIDEAGIYFRFGRTTNATAVSQIDQNTGDFIEARVNRAPYTHVLLDFRLEIAGIVRKASVAPNSGSIATRLTKVLNISDFARREGCSFSIGPIRDPDALLETLNKAASIRSFTFSAQRKNPIDVNKLFVEPFEKYVQAVGATDGKVTVTGHSLDTGVLTDIVRSAAATGDTAKARVQLAKGERPVHRSLGGPETISVKRLDTQESRMKALALVREEYSRIRGDHETT